MSVPLQIQTQIAPKGGLESVAAPMPLTETDWRTGVQLTSVCVLQPFVWGCSSEDDKDVSSVPDVAEFQSTTIGVEVKCGPNGPNSPIGDIASAIASQGLERTRWAKLAGVLSDGVVGGGSVGSFGTNPSLQSTATLGPNLVLAAPKCLDVAIADVLSGICECYQSDTVLHVPFKFLPHFLWTQLVVWNPASGTYQMGTIDVSFDCYPNLGTPAAEIATPTLQDGSEVWIYASPRPLAAFSLEQNVNSIQVQQNEYLVEASRGAIIAFDPCCVYASKALLIKP